MIGLLSLAAAVALVAVSALRLALALQLRSRGSTLLAAYCLGWAEVVVVMVGLSPFHGVTPVGTLASFAVVALVVYLVTRRRVTLTDGGRGTLGGDLRSALADPVLVTLGVAVLAGLAYSLVLGLATPQNDFDTIYDHLWRAVLWFEHAAVGYPDCACAPYINAYPPVGELGPALTMVLGRADRYVALPQALALASMVVGVAALARRIGRPRREALLSGLLVATLPVVALQASTAQNDLLVASFLVAATVFLLDRAPSSPWLAGLALALALGTKVSAPYALPLLLAVAVLGRPVAGRAGRVLAVVAGTGVGGIWYLINRHQTGSLDGGFPEIPVEHTPVAALGRISRFGIELVDLSGARGADLYLYAVVGLVVAAALVLGRRRAPRSALLVGGAAFLIAASPVLLPHVGTFLERAHVNVFELLGRSDLNVDIGRDIRRSASNFSWYGPLGSLLFVGVAVWSLVAVRRGAIDRLGVLFALAPFYWLVAFGATLYYQDFAGRFFMYPIALAVATWGVVLRHRALAWGVAAIAVTSLGLALLNDTKRPSGIRLLEPGPAASYFTTPRWQAQGAEARAADLTRYIDEQLPADASVALAISPSDPGYLFYGPGLDRRVSLIEETAADAPGAAWAFASPNEAGLTLCASAWEELPDRPQGWRVLRRVAAHCG